MSWLFKFKNHKRPLVITMAILFTAAYFVWDYEQQVAETQRAYFDYYESQVKQLNAYVKLARDFREPQFQEELRGRLEDGRKLGFLDFYVLRRKGEPIWWKSTYAPIDFYKVDLKKTDEEVRSPSSAYYNLMLDPQTKLTMGVVNDVNGFIKKAHENAHINYLLIQDSAGVLIIILLVGWWSLRDIISLNRKIRLGKDVDLKNFKANSVEAEIMARGLSSFSQTLKETENEKLRFENQLLPSLRGELKSLKKPPYDFECTMVRTDINNFSKIYSQYDVDQLMLTINQFFTELSHIVSNYNGYVHEFLGDEAIYYFKDEDHENSLQVALAAIRDIQDLAHKFHLQTEKERGYAFTVKSSLAHGVIRFGPLVSGFSLAGSVLIETVRILAHIHEKNENVVAFDARFLPEVSEFVETQVTAQVELKGMSGERTLVAVRNFRSIDSVLEDLKKEELRTKTVEFLTNYRSDQDLLKILQFLESKSDQEALSLRAVVILQKFTITKSYPDVINVIVHWIETLRLTEDSESGAKLLSAVLHLLQNFCTQELFTPSTAKTVEGLLNFPERRVVANALEVLAKFKTAEDSDFVQRLKDHSDNRVTGNALLFLGRDKITSDVVKGVRHLIESSDLAMKATGLYVLHSLARHHQKRDPVYLAAQLEFQDLFRLVIPLAQHKDQRVRFQAEKALKEAQSRAA
jgi:hypothetical protein